MLLVDCLLDFLAHLDATEPGLARAIAVKTFLAKELKHQCDPTLKSKRDFSFDVEALSSELKLQAFFTDYQISCVDRDFQLCLDLLTNMGFFVGYTSSEKLLKFILFTQKFKSDVLGLNLSEINKQDFLKKLFKTQHRPTSSSVPISEVLLSSTIWNDLDVALLKPARQVVIDSSTTRLDLGMHAIQEHIAQRAKAGPNIKYTFCLFFVSFLSIALVAVSNSVRESPYLFRLLWALAYAINAVTVSIPGRLDRMFKEGQHIKPWHTLFEPACWAFSIWAVIYFMELALTIYVCVVGIPPDLFQMMVPYWLAGNWFQALWCFAFRPEFQHALWVPMSCLLLAASTFGVAHFKITQYMRPLALLPWCAMMLFRLPIAMHTAWLASATLLTFNSWLSVSQVQKVLQIIAAFASAFAAATMGSAIMYYTQDAIIGLTFAWALDGLACRALERSLTPQELAAPDIYEALSVTETWLANLLKLLSVGVLASPWLLSAAIGSPKYAWKRVQER